MRFAPVGSELETAELASARERLQRELARVTFSNGSSAFQVRAPEPKEAFRQAHAAVVIDTERATTELLVDGKPLTGAVRSLTRLTGTHDRHTRGILLAAGPAIVMGRPPAKISIHDITPSLLYALGLPVAEDFSGRVQLALFTDEFRQSTTGRTVASWGRLTAAEAPRTSADRQLLEELAGLGYLR